MADPTGTTKLEAVNGILSSLNEAPVNSLGSNATGLASHAEAMLDRVNKEVQSKGWEFNLEFNVDMVPNGATEIVTPVNAAWVHVPGKFGSGSAAGTTYSLYTTRDGKLYNRSTKATTGFDTTLKATICYMLEFVKVPEIAKRYIELRASRMLADQVRSNVQRHAAMLQDEVFAKQDLQEQEGIQEEFTIFDNFDAFQALDRQNPVLGTSWR